MVELGVARIDDLPQLVALLTILFSQEAEFTPDYGKQTRALEKILSDESAGTVYVAREDGLVVAMASLIYTVSTAEGGTAALFEDLVVLPTYRGQGIATHCRGEEARRAAPHAADRHAKRAGAGVLPQARIRRFVDETHEAQAMKTLAALCCSVLLALR
jgi:GNAT superfamily N-acetyltransferase